jgi:hypothetical protein
MFICVDLENYPNKESVWGYDEITKIIQQRVSTMPDLPRQVAIILSWSDSEDESVKQTFGDTGAAYDVLALKWLDKPFRLFFLSLAPDSPLRADRFLDLLCNASFSECFLLRQGTALLRMTKLESLEEAQRKHSPGALGPL